MNDKSGERGLIKTSNFTTSLITVEEQSRLLDLIKTLANGKKLKMDNHTDALALCIKAKELNLPMGTALDHCFIVNGKVGIDVHIAKAKLLESGVITWEKIHDYKPLLSYTNGVLVFLENELPENHVVVHKINGNDAQVNKLREEGKFPVAIIAKDGVPIIKDYITTYKFTRLIKMIDGKFKEIVEVSSFSVSEAVSAGLISTETHADSPWIKYRKRMLEHRAYMNGARAIGDDLLLGMYSVPELLDMDGKHNYQLNDDDTVTVYEEVK